jgi:molybdenum-dependent DNA-binding transcriptional regulator ModE
VENLRRSARGGWQTNGEATPTEILEALLASLEELHPAVEDLRQQNEELIATRDALDEE